MKASAVESIQFSLSRQIGIHQFIAMLKHTYEQRRRPFPQYGYFFRRQHCSFTRLSSLETLMLLRNRFDNSRGQGQVLLGSPLNCKDPAWARLSSSAIRHATKYRIRRKARENGNQRVRHRAIRLEPARLCVPALPRNGLGAIGSPSVFRGWTLRCVLRGLPGRVGSGSQVCILSSWAGKQ